MSCVFGDVLEPEHSRVVLSGCLERRLVMCQLCPALAGVRR